MIATPAANTLYYGDNLAILREHVADESVDLVYLDPPFNSNASYNVLFKAPDGHQSQARGQRHARQTRFVRVCELDFFGPVIRFFDTSHEKFGHEHRQSLLVRPVAGRALAQSVPD